MKTTVGAVKRFIQEAIDASVELPRKEAVRTLLDVFKTTKLNKIPDMPRGYLREIASQIVDSCQKFTNESPYKTRFRILGNLIQALVRHRPVAVIDLGELAMFIVNNVLPATDVKQLQPREPTLGTLGAFPPWARVLGGFGWKPFMAVV